jgi:cysteine desulfurase
MLFKKTIYLDNTATTRTRREVVSTMMKYFKRDYGNPSSIHTMGNITRGSIEMARERIARVLNCASDEIFFTGSGTESNNLAIRGMQKLLGGHVVSCGIEHSSILETCKSLENDGSKVSYIKVSKSGKYDLEELSGIVKNNADMMVALSYANNEIGTVQDIGKIVSIVKGNSKLMHIDAVQALPYFKIDLSAIKADTMSFSGHKLYAPKGVGVLFVRRGTPLKEIMTGGRQEFGLRSGTENVAYIVGISKAICLNDMEKEKYVGKLLPLRNLLIQGVLSSLKDVMLTGDADDRAPNHASFCIKGVNGKMLVKRLSWYGIEASSGAACSSPRNDPSHVLKACGIDDDYIYGSLRLTLGKYNSKSDVDHLLNVLPKIIEKMRTATVNYDNRKIFISQEELKQIINEKTPVVILDVRHFLYPGVMIPGSIHMPVWNLKRRMKELDKDADIIVVCYQGDVYSPEVQELLVKNGFKNVRVLKGGLYSYVGHRPY